MSKHTFKLDNLDIDAINSKYDLTSSKKSSSEFSSLTQTNSSRVESISYFDESKRLHSCIVSMIDYRSRIQTSDLKYNCFWCRHPFDTQPIGCPIKYVSKFLIKRYNSNISRSTYSIKENVSENRFDKDKSLIQSPDDYYETDGVFCSYNCCQAYIIDNKHNSLYTDSESLLMKMYNQNSSSVSKIQSAPHWRLLTEYGGKLSISKFREGFDKVDYESHGMTRQLPDFVSLISLFEDHVKF